MKRFGRSNDHTGITRRSRVVIGVAAALSIGLGGALAYAYLTNSATGTGAGAVGSLGSPSPVAGSPSGSTVAISWGGVTKPAPGTFGYYITRTPYPSGTAVNVCSSSPTLLLPASPTACSDTSVPSGNYTYTVTAVYNTWTRSASSSEVTVVANPPTASAPGVTASTNFGTNPYWVNRENVSLTDAPSTNGGTAIASVSYYYCAVAAAPCTSSNWMAIGSPSTTGPSYSVVWSLTSLPTDGRYDVVAVATNVSLLGSAVSSATVVGIDTTGPLTSAPSTTASVNYGSNPTYVNNESVALTDPSVVDAGSGVRSVAYYYCAGSTGACNTTLIGSSSTASGNYPVTWSPPLPTDGSYRIEAVSTDNVNNTATSATALVAVDTTPPMVSTPSVNGIA